MNWSSTKRKSSKTASKKVETTVAVFPNLLRWQITWQFKWLENSHTYEQIFGKHLCSRSSGWETLQCSDNQLNQYVIYNDF